MNNTLNENLESILALEISEERRAVLQPLIEYIKSKRCARLPHRWLSSSMPSWHLAVLSV